MSNKKATFVTIIILLVIFLPLTIIGYFTTNHYNPLEENPSHTFKYEGDLWFYNENDEFISKYNCTNPTCELTKTIIDDEEYGLNYYKEGTKENIPIINYKYAFITDGVLIQLYDIINGKVLSSYKAVKDYHTDLENDVYIIQNSDNIWGAFSINEGLVKVLPFDYDFIGLPNNKTSNVLATRIFIVLKDNSWYLVDNNDSALSGYIPLPIVDFNENFIIGKDADSVKIYDYADIEYFTDLNISNYARVDNYLGLLVDNNLYICDGLNTNYLKVISLNETDGNITLTIDANNLNVLVDEEIIDTIAL